MCYNNCEICQYNENLKQGEKLLSEAIYASVFALMSKTEDAYEKERVAHKAWSDFSEENTWAYTRIENILSNVLQEG